MFNLTNSRPLFLGRQFDSGHPRFSVAMKWVALSALQKMRNAECGMRNQKRRMANARWQMTNAKWQMTNARWQMTKGRTASQRQR